MAKLFVIICLCFMVVGCSQDERVIGYKKNKPVIFQTNTMGL